VLRLAVERFPNEGDKASVRRSDLDAMIEPRLVGVLSMLLHRDSPFLAGFQGGEQDSWTAPVDDRVVNYWDASSIDDFLRIRAEEMKSHPQLGWVVPRADEITPSTKVALAEPEQSAVPRIADGSSTATPGQLGVVRGERVWKLGDQLDRGGMGQVFEAEGSDGPAVISWSPRRPGRNGSCCSRTLKAFRTSSQSWIGASGTITGSWSCLGPTAHSVRIWRNTTPCPLTRHSRSSPISPTRSLASKGRSCTAT
jgi:hypothetical protein